MCQLISIGILLILFGCKSPEILNVPLKESDQSDKSLGVTEYFSQRIRLTGEESFLPKQFSADSAILSLFSYNGEYPYSTAELIDNHLLFQHSNPDSSSLFLLGMLGDSIYIVADVNNNNRFEDDKIIAVHKRILKSQRIKEYENLPTVRMKNLIINWHGKSHLFTRRFFLLPNTSTDGRLSLRLITNEQRAGRFRFKGRIFYVRARQSSSGYFAPNPAWTNIRIADKKNRNQNIFNEKLIHHVGDTVVLKKQSFIIQSVSPLIDTVVLKPVSER